MDYLSHLTIGLQHLLFINWGVVLMYIHVCTQVCEPMCTCSEGRLLGVTLCSSLPLFPSYKGLSVNLEIISFGLTGSQ